MKFINRLMLLLIVAVPCATFAAWKLGLLETPELPREVRIRVNSDFCAQLAGYDDGANDDERLAMAVATINLAKKETKTTCQVYENFDALIGPGSWTLLPWFRWTMTMETVSKLSAGQKVAYDTTGQRLEKYLNDPAEDLQKFPWLSCVTHYIRSTWSSATPRPDFSLRTKMRQVWRSPIANKNGLHAEFFCPK